MKFSFKSFCAGILCSSMIFSCGVTAYAAYKKTATLDYPGIKIVVNGQQVTPTNASGKAVEPFAIDGTTYLPVRAVSNSLGMNVDWNAATKSVVITSNNRASDLLKYYKLLEESFSFLYEQFGALSSDKISMYTSTTEISGSTYANAMKNVAQSDLTALESWYQYCYSSGQLSDEDIALAGEKKPLWRSEKQGFANYFANYRTMRTKSCLIFRRQFENPRMYPGVLLCLRKGVR